MLMLWRSGKSATSLQRKDANTLLLPYGFYILLQVHSQQSLHTVHWCPKQTSLSYHERCICISSVISEHDVCPGYDHRQPRITSSLSPATLTVIEFSAGALHSAGQPRDPRTGGGTGLLGPPPTWRASQT